MSNANIPVDAAMDHEELTSDGDVVRIRTAGPQGGASLRALNMRGLRREPLSAVLLDEPISYCGIRGGVAVIGARRSRSCVGHEILRSHIMRRPADPNPHVRRLC